MKGINKIIFHFLLFTPLGLFSQLITDEQATKYSSEDAIFLEHNVDIEVGIDKLKLPEIKSKHYYKKYFTNSRARLYNEDNIYDSYIHKISDVKAVQFDLLPNGKYKKMKVNSPDTVKPFSSTIFYDDVISLKFNFNSLKEKSYTELSYEETLTDFHFFGRETVASYFPIVNGYLQVRIDKNINLAYQEHYFDGHDIIFSKTEDGGDLILRWEMKNVEAFRPQNQMVSYLSLVPSITFQIASYIIDDQTVDVFPDTNKMYDWYYNKVDTVMQKENDSLKAFTLSILNDSMTDFEKVKTIYYWVQKNVKYIAIEYGNGAIIPRPPNLVYDRRYGDCKDMACLTKKMIGYAGLEANLVWIGTRDIPYKFREVPSPVVTNHMICSYTENGKIYFLDATATSNPIDLPSHGIQGKEALVEYGKDQYKIVDVPIMESMKSGKVDSCQLKMKGTSLIGDCHCSFSGYTATTMRQILSMQNKSEDRDFYTGALNKGSNKFVLTSYEVHDLNNFDKSIKVDYKFQIDDYAQKLDNKYFVNINVAQYLRGNKFDLNTFKYDFDGEYKFIDREVNDFKVPEGFEISSVPGNWDLNEEDYLFEINYNIDKENGKVLLNRNIQIDYMEYPVDRFEEWNNSVDKLNQNYKNVIVLEKGL